MKKSSTNRAAGWRFLTNHSRVLAYVASHPQARLRDIAVGVDITERTATVIVNELKDAGYLTTIRDGRRNHYEVHLGLPLRHPEDQHLTAGDLIRFLQRDGRRGTAGARTRSGRKAKPRAT